MPIETGVYCQYCADERGNLHPFEESFERMAQFMSRQTPGISPDEAKKQTLVLRQVVVRGPQGHPLAAKRPRPAPTNQG